VDYILTMTVRHCSKQLRYNVNGNFLTQKVVLYDVLEQFPTLAYLANQMKIVFILVELDNSHNVGMVDFPKYSDLIPKFQFFSF
jgi:hypothetical protein